MKRLKDDKVRDYLLCSSTGPNKFGWWLAPGYGTTVDLDLAYLYTLEEADAACALYNRGTIKLIAVRLPLLGCGPYTIEDVEE